MWIFHHANHSRARNHPFCGTERSPDQAFVFEFEQGHVLAAVEWKDGSIGMGCWWPVAVTCTAWTSTLGQRRWNGRGTFLGETFEGIWKWYEVFQNVSVLHEVGSYCTICTILSAESMGLLHCQFLTFCQELVWELPSWKIPVLMAHEQKEEEWGIKFRS